MQSTQPVKKKVTPSVKWNEHKCTCKAPALNWKLDVTSDTSITNVYTSVEEEGKKGEVKEVPKEEETLKVTVVAVPPGE